MKKIKVTLLVLTSIVAMTALPTQAIADNAACDASNPCGTWAVVSTSGEVQNVITCQSAVCGTNGSWGGKMPDDTFCPGCKIVLQVPADPVKHTPSSEGFYSGQPSVPDRVVAYDQTNSQFVMNTGLSIVKTENYSDGTSLTILSTSVFSKSITFKPEDFQNGEMKLTPVIDNQTGAELYVYHYVHEGVATPTVESITFDSPKTKEEIKTAIEYNNYTLLLTWLDDLFNMLGNWGIPTP